MSLILEALRKSEEQRRLGEAPTLASVPVWTRRQPRRPWLPFAIGALVVAAVVGGWWLGQRDPQTTDTQKRGSADVRSIAARERARTTAPEIVAPTTAAVAPAGATATPDARSAGRPPPQARAERETPEVFANSPDLVRPAPPTQGTPYVPPEAALPAPLPDPENTALDPAMPPVTPPPAPPVPPPAVTPPPAPASVATAPAPADTVPTPAAGTVPAVPTGADAVPLIFELPLATRQELPPLKLNMHVYDADPAARFVILDGARAGEGGAASKDINVIEIRPDGIVLEFRSQRFFVPRTGR